MGGAEHRAHGLAHGGCLQTVQVGPLSRDQMLSRVLRLKQSISVKKSLVPEQSQINKMRSRFPPPLKETTRESEREG